MTDDRKISEHRFSEMNFSFVNIINLTKINTYVEGHFRVGAHIVRMLQAKENEGKVKIL